MNILRRYKRASFSTRSVIPVMASYLKAGYRPVYILFETLICDLLCICITINIYKKQNYSIIIINLYTGMH